MGVFRSARSLARSSPMSKKRSSHVVADEGAGEQMLEEGGEYVVVAAADEIEKCGSNLIISPENTIYLPDIFDNENEKNITSDGGDENINPTNEDFTELTVVNEKHGRKDDNVDDFKVGETFNRNTK